MSAAAGGSLHKQVILGHSLGVLQFNSILTLSTCASDRRLGIGGPNNFPVLGFHQFDRATHRTQETFYLLDYWFIIKR